MRVLGLVGAAVLIALFLLVSTGLWKQFLAPALLEPRPVDPDAGL